MTDKPIDFEAIARERCAPILNSTAMLALSGDAHKALDALMILAFSFGAAWALDIDPTPQLRRALTDTFGKSGQPHDE